MKSRKIHINIEEITPYNYFVTGIMDQRRYKILINTGQEENYIMRELVLETEIIKTRHLWPGLPSEIITTNEEITEKEIIIGGTPLVIPFKICQGSQNITLRIKWLEKVKPYNIENKQLTITYQNKKIIIKRTKWIMKKYILAKIIVEGYYNRYYTPMIDTRAEANICKYNCLPEDKWKKLKTHMVVTRFNNEGSMITYKEKNIKTQIWDKILTIEETYNFEFTTKDMLLWMPFLEKFYPHIITKTHWWFTTPCVNKIGANKVYNNQRKPIEWIKESEKINLEMENIRKN